MYLLRTTDCLCLLLAATCELVACGGAVFPGCPRGTSRSWGSSSRCPSSARLRCCPVLCAAIAPGRDRHCRCGATSPSSRTKLPIVAASLPAPRSAWWHVSSARSCHVITTRGLGHRDGCSKHTVGVGVSPPPPLQAVPPPRRPRALSNVERNTRTCVAGGFDDRCSSCSTRRCMQTIPAKGRLRMGARRHRSQRTGCARWPR